MLLTQKFSIFAYLVIVKNCSHLIFSQIRVRFHIFFLDIPSTQSSHSLNINLKF
jgi:hypothetical protein